MAVKLDARDKLGVARLKVWDTHPYLMEVLFKLKPVERSSIATLAVDDGLRLYYNAAFVEATSVEELATILVHECQHVLRNHPMRGDVAMASGIRGRYESVASVLQQAFGLESFEHALNVCGDLEINDDITGMPWPKHAPPVMPNQFGLRDGSSMEEYVVSLVEWAERQPKQPSGGGGEEDGEDQNPSGGAGGQSGSGDNGEGSHGEDEGSEEQEGEGEGSPDEDESDGEGEQDGDRRGDGDEGDPDDGQDDPREGEGSGDEDDDAGAGRSDGGTGPAPLGDEPKGHVGHGNCGACAGRTHDERLSQGDDVPDPTSSDELEVAKVQVAHAVMEAIARGNAPAGWMVEWAKKMFQKPETDWRKVLAAHMVGAVSAARGNVDWRVGPPSRRREVLKTLGHGEEAPILPVLRGPEPKVTFVLDTSGSMGRGPGSRLDVAINEAYGLAKMTGCVTFGMACDAAVHASTEVRSPADMMALARGGGGTDMRIGIKAAAEEKHRPDVIVLITDAETPWPTKAEMPKRSRLVVCVVGRSKWSYDNMPDYIKKHAVYVNGGNY